MGHRFAAIAFTESVREVQQALGSRASYAAMEEGGDYNQVLGAREADFITARDSFYMASVSETGWPYVQHRGGPAGFVRILDEQRIGFADFGGNRQYVSVGNLRKDDRVALFFMDYANRTRLKLLGRVRLIDAKDEALLGALEDGDYQARVERGFVINVEAFDWNCPQHITPRYTESQIEAITAPLIEDNRVLRAALDDTRRPPPAVLGDGPLELVISGIRELTPRIRAFELRDANGGELPAVEAGSHLQVPVVLDNGKSAVRHYSISSDPARRDAYEIAVLRDDEGEGGSRAVHQQFNIGQHLHCTLPGNYFRLHAGDRPAVLIAGGVGITPIKAMAHTLKDRGSVMHLHYAVRSARETAFRYELRRDFANELTIYSSSDGERMPLERILSGAPDDAIFYVCGPGHLIDAVVATATTLGIDLERVRFERFAATANHDASPVRLELRRSGKQLEVAANESVLDAMLDAGVDAPFNCRAGNCKACVVRVLAGDPDHRDSVLSAAERQDARLMLPCVSRATSDHLVLDA
ncbi:MAG: 2Fe-2S iron-sulfur cluster-binding protein [Gammaproteobacteria bacterium]